MTDDAIEGNLPEYSVSELSGAVKRTMEDAFSYVRVRGELGRISRPQSGHVYLDLKDDRAVLAGVIWKGTASRLPVELEQGLEVIATGRMTTFPGQSKYQLVIERIEPAGIGALLAQLEERRKKLAAEGLFDTDRKSPLPLMPQVIGVVTSPTGAVIRDILHRLRERHHHLARCLASGMSQVEASIVTGYDQSRISILKGDPAFAELIEFYREKTDAIYAELHTTLSGLSRDAAEELRQRIEDQGHEMPVKTLIEIVKLSADRTGHGPSTKSEVNHNHTIGFADRLERARTRATRADEIREIAQDVEILPHDEG